MSSFVRIAVAGALLSVLVSGAAQAQNYPSAGALRIGAFGQGSSSTFDVQRFNSTDGSLGFSGSTSQYGMGAGIVAGYDWALDKSWRFGIEADVAIDNGRGKADAGRGFNSDFLATARARLGYQVTPVWMLYATGGYALHAVEYRGLATPSNTAAAKMSATQGGAVLGLGTEYDLSGYTLFAEVLYTNPETRAFRAPDVNYAYRVDDTTAVARLGVKFKVGYDYFDDVRQRGAGARR